MSISKTSVPAPLVHSLSRVAPFVVWSITFSEYFAPIALLISGKYTMCVLPKHSSKLGRAVPHQVTMEAATSCSIPDYAPISMSMNM